MDLEAKGRVTIAWPCKLLPSWYKVLIEAFWLLALVYVVEVGSW